MRTETRRNTSAPTRARPPSRTRPQPAPLTKRPRSRPSGKARNTCKKSTGGTRSIACPTVCKTSLVDHTSVETKLTKPAAIISGPRRLAGRRRHAKRPQSTYDSVSKAVSIAITRGSPTSTPTPPPATASMNEVAAAAHPTIAIAQETDTLGLASAERRSEPAAHAEAAMNLPSPCRHPTEPLRRGRDQLHGSGRKKSPTVEHTPGEQGRGALPGSVHPTSPSAE